MDRLMENGPIAYNTIGSSASTMNIANSANSPEATKQELKAILMRLKEWREQSMPAPDEEEFEAISRVEYDADRTHVRTISAHPVYGESVGEASLYTRMNILRSLQAGAKYMMMRQNENGAWLRGLPINIVTINGMEYLKTGSDQEETDRLDFGI